MLSSQGGEGTSIDHRLALFDFLTEDQDLHSVTEIAERLNMLRLYLSDLLKQETSKTAIEQIHMSLVRETKNRLRNNAQNVSEVAYQLAIENLSHF